jgi:hypothetical protein
MLVLGLQSDLMIKVLLFKHVGAHIYIFLEEKTVHQRMKLTLTETKLTMMKKTKLTTRRLYAY